MSQKEFDSTDEQQPWALVTGASAGIGSEFCRQLAARGYRLVLVARREEKLRAVADELKRLYATQSVIISADLAEKNAFESVLDQLQQKNIEIDYLVNNAGYGMPGSFHVSDWQAHADFIQVMLTSVCEFTRGLLPGMRERGRGHIINVASVAALVPASGGHTLYGASKSFLVKFGESLALENANSGVKVTSLCPGFTYSEFHDVNGTRGMVSQMPSYLWLDAKFVVSEALNAMEADHVKPIIVPGKQYKALVFFNRYLPWLAALFIKKNASNFRVTE